MKRIFDYFCVTTLGFVVGSFVASGFIRSPKELGIILIGLIAARGAAVLIGKYYDHTTP